MKKTRKVLSITLVLCAILTLLPVSASAASSYDSSKALAYAKAHWNDGNELCAGFVSNCLKAGGLSSWNRECTNLYNQLNKEVVNGARIASIQYLKTSGNYIKVADNKGKVSKGDVLFWLCSGCPSDTVGGPYQHTALVSDVSGTYIKVYQHNGAVNNQAAYVGACYECARPYSDMVVVHFNSTFSTPKVTKYFDCDVQLNTSKGTRVNLYSNPTDKSYKTYFDRGQTATSTRGAKLSDGSTWYEFQAYDENNRVVTLWLNAKSNGVKVIDNKMASSDTQTSQISAGVYVIQAGIGNNMVLDCEKGSQTAGTKILLWERHNAENQQIRVVPLDNGNYALQLVHSGQVLDVEKASTKSGARVIQWNWNGGANQQWKIVLAGNGYYYIVSVLSGMTLDVSGGHANLGADIIVYQPHYGDNQKFRFVPVG